MTSSPLRGALILFEGVDRCGKSTQSAMLNKYLGEKYKGKSSLIRFPDRDSNIGKLIDSYLQSKCNLSDEAIHLLFSANRWEASHTIISDLNSGKNLVPITFSDVLLWYLLIIDKDAYSSFR